MNSRSIVTGLAAFSLLTSLSACKPVRSEQASKPAQGNPSLQATQKMGGELSLSDLKIDFSSSNHESANYMDGVTRDGNVLQLKKRIMIAGSKSKEGASYLVLPEVVGNRKIVDASYERRTVAPTNESYSEAHRSLLSYDHDRHEYFLPLKDLKDEVGHGLSSLDLQILDLTLNLDDGSNSHVEVRFYVKADLPSADLIRSFQRVSEPQTVTAQGSAREQVRQLSFRDGWSVMTERYTNPTSEPLVLWFSSKGINYRLETELGAKFLGVMAGDFIPNTRTTIDDGFETDMHRYAKASLERVNLVLSSSKNNQARTIPLSKESPIPVEIDPGEALIVEWRVSSEANAPSCSDGVRTTRTVQGCDMTQLRKILGNGLQRPAGCGQSGAQFTGTQEIAGVWLVKQFRVSGEFKNDVQVTEDAGTTPQDLDRAKTENRTVSLPTTSSAPDAWGSAAEMYGCQGIF